MSDILLIALLNSLSILIAFALGRYTRKDTQNPEISSIYGIKKSTAGASVTFNGTKILSPKQRMDETLALKDLERQEAS